MPPIHLQPPSVDPVPISYKFHTTAAVLRLDKVHHVVSGNKWYKLQGYIEEAISGRKTGITTFGGAYSNHILATAAACAAAGLQSRGIIRGEEPKELSPTLHDALRYGMTLSFTDREAYRNKAIPPEWQSDNYLVVNEGGYGLPGRKGSEEILKHVDLDSYTHIMAAVGTGTTLAGLATAAAGRRTIGISVMKNNASLGGEIAQLLPARNKPVFTVNHDYHFGGYAKGDKTLFRFMNEWYQATGIPTDFVYTGKLFFAFNHLAANGFFEEGSNVLVIHSGGLQGNRSLSKGTLIF